MTGFIAAKGQPKPQCQQFASVLVEHSSFWDARQFLLRIAFYVSKSREKSYGTNTQTAPKQQKQQYFFLLCLGASLCNSGLLAGVKMSPEVSGSDPKWSLSGGPKIQPYQQG